MKKILFMLIVVLFPFSSFAETSCLTKKEFLKEYKATKTYIHTDTVKKYGVKVTKIVEEITASMTCLCAINASSWFYGESSQEEVVIKIDKIKDGWIKYHVNANSENKKPLVAWAEYSKKDNMWEFVTWANDESEDDKKFAKKWCDELKIPKFIQ